eukprot:jgi/Tetstr1/462287/TSEL_007305.t1
MDSGQLSSLHLARQPTPGMNLGIVAPAICPLDKEEEEKEGKEEDNQLRERWPSEGCMLRATADPVRVQAVGP